MNNILNELVKFRIKDKGIKNYFLLFLAIIFLIFAIFVQTLKISRVSKIEKTNERLLIYRLENKIYLLREAKTPLEWQKGLMFVRKPTNYDGMVFIFPDKQIRNFWNQNTFVDLDVYWLEDNKIIGKDYLPSIEKSKTVKIIISPVPVNKVIEIIR